MELRVDSAVIGLDPPLDQLATLCQNADLRLGLVYVDANLLDGWPSFCGLDRVRNHACGARTATTADRTASHFVSSIRRTGDYVLNLPAAGCLGWVVDYGATALTLSLADVPVQLQGLTIAANKSDLTWAAPPINPATLYDVVRGDLAQLPVGSTANETCIAQGIAITTASDPNRPGAGHGFWYLVRERIRGCANGTYGFASNGTERNTSTCP